MKHFKFYSKEALQSLTNKRPFEIKLGERIHAISDTKNWKEALKYSTAKYIIAGIPEDMGVKANLGIGGAATVWQPFLSSFLNIQSNEFLTGEDILILGYFDFGDIDYLIEQNAYNAEELTAAYRHAVSIIDGEVEMLINEISFLQKIPLLIGGGHNNAYPIIKGVAKGLQKAGKLVLAQINIINLDAHADFRNTEGRHSGNAFRYASEDGYLGKYAMVGLHENYISQNVLMEIHNNPFIHYTSYEEIFLQEKTTFLQAVKQAIDFTEDTFTGIEVDLDCIENILCSAATPAGIKPVEARQFVTFVARAANAAYLHICEGATQLADGRTNVTTGKLISYLVTDFIKAATPNIL